MLDSSPGFKILRELVQQQCRVRRMQVFGTTIGGLDQCFELARLQGEVAGLQGLAGLHQLLLEDTIRDIELKKQEIEEHGTGRPELV